MTNQCVVTGMKPKDSKILDRKFADLLRNVKINLMEKGKIAL
jgi:hypothetical protein